MNEALSYAAKALLEKKLNLMRNDILYYQSQTPTPKSMLHIFILKNKLGSMYQYLGLTESSIEVFRDLWYQTMYNYRYMLKLKD